MRSRYAALAAAIVLPLSIGCGAAQDIGLPSRGLALAQRLCSECHVVDKRQARSPNPDAPRFAAIAGSPGMTSIALLAALNTSHQSMQNILLEPDEQADIIAYILTLR